MRRVFDPKRTRSRPRCARQRPILAQTDGLRPATAHTMANLGLPHRPTFPHPAAKRFVQAAFLIGSAMRKALSISSRNTLSWSRAERPSSSMAALRMLWASGLSLQIVRTWRGVIRPLTAEPWRYAPTAWSAVRGPPAPRRGTRTTARGGHVGELGEGERRGPRRGGRCGRAGGRRSGSGTSRSAAACTSRPAAGRSGSRRGRGSSPPRG